MEGFFALVLLCGMWVGPAVAALLLALLRSPERRRVLLGATAIALAPFLFVEALCLAGALRGHYDGFCRHASDIRDTCSYPRYLVESMLPFGTFAAVGFFILGIPAFAWGLVAVFIGLRIDRAHTAEPRPRSDNPERIIQR